MSIEERVRDKRLLQRIVRADKAVAVIQDGMTVATTGNAFSGFPRTVLLAMAERLSARNQKVAVFCAGALGREVEEAFDQGNVVYRRLGSLGSTSARKAVVEGRMRFLDVKSGLFPLQVARGDYGSVDVALIEAVAITKDGHIVPSTALIDGPRWVQCAERVVVEINPWISAKLEGFHDVFLPDPQPGARPIPLHAMDQQIGTPHMVVEGDKIYAIVETTAPMPAAEKVREPNEVNRQIAGNFVRFLESEMETGKLPTPPPPLELGIGALAEVILERLKASGLKSLSLYLPGVTEGVLDLIDAGKVAFVAATNLRMGKTGLNRFFTNIERYRSIILRPLDVINNGDVIRRMNVIALNAAIEVDVLGQVNSSHLMGVKIVGGIGGAYDYARNARLSVFLTPSTAKGGDISCVVPLVSHVDHTEHDADVIITERGVADVRGLDPMERAVAIIQLCSHPEYRQELVHYLEKAKRQTGGRQPIVMAEAFSFHQRFAAHETMKQPI